MADQKADEKLLTDTEAEDADNRQAEPVASYDAGTQWYQNPQSGTDAGDPWPVRQPQKVDNPPENME